MILLAPTPAPCCAAALEIQVELGNHTQELDELQQKQFDKVLEMHLEMGNTALDMDDKDTALRIFKSVRHCCSFVVEPFICLFSLNSPSTVTTGNFVFTAERGVQRAQC